MIVPPEVSVALLLLFAVLALLAGTLLAPVWIPVVLAFVAYKLVRAAPRAAAPSPRRRGRTPQARRRRLSGSSLTTSRRYPTGGAENRTSIEGVACLYPPPGSGQYAPILIGRPHDTRPFNSQASAPGLL